MADELDPATSGSAPSTPPMASTTPLAVATGARPDAGAPAAVSTAGKVWRAIDRGPQGKPWRVVSIVLLVLGCVLAPIGVTAGWAKNLVVDQDHYLAAVAPLITDPVIVQAAENRMVAAIDDAISNLDLADKIGDELESLGLPPKLATLATTYLATFRTDITDAITKMVDQLFESPKLATLWVEANTRLHTKFVQLMQGEDPGRLHALNVDLSSAVSQIKQKLESSGVSWAGQIPDVPVVIDLAGNADVQKIAGYYDLLDTLGSWLPITAVVLLLLSILIAPSRLGGLSKAAGWLAVSMVVLIVALIGGREWLVSQAPTQPQVTEAFARQLTVDLRNTIRTILVTSAVISALAWLFGSSRSAVGLRRQVGGLADRVRDSHWHLLVRVGAAVVALAAVLVLVMLDNPGVLLAVVLAVLAGLTGYIAVSPQRGGPPEVTDDGAAAPPTPGAEPPRHADVPG